MKPTICTFSGIEFAPLAPRIEDVTAVDIAHALSNMPRFSGHTSRFYSVAQHSVSVSFGCGVGVAAAYGLLHDASEAYLLDVPSPLKSIWGGYREAEERVQRVVYLAFGLDPERVPLAVKEADAAALFNEQRDLMPTVAWWEKRSAIRLDFGSQAPRAPMHARDLFVGRLADLHVHGLIPNVPGGLAPLLDLHSEAALMRQKVQEIGWELDREVQL